MRILFMGTPDIALTSLKALYESGEEIVGVVTQPDKPKGRGYTLTPPPTKVYATEKGIPVYQPLTLKGEDFMEILSNLSPDLIAVVAYGRILPKQVLDFPKYGCVNVHGSLLPKYRGAAPIQRAIIDGEKTTGITTMLMAEGLDTGDMLLKSEVSIEEDDNFETLHDKLAQTGAQTLLKTVELLRDGKITPMPQDDSLSTYAAKIEKSDCALDFSKTAREVCDRIRGLSPIPVAFTHTPDGKLLKIFAAAVNEQDSDNSGSIGVVETCANGFLVKCGRGSIIVKTVIPEGKGRMNAADFVRGRKIASGDILK